MQPYLGCVVTAIKLDFDKCIGHVYMPFQNCTDMARTIAFFEGIDSDIDHIVTWQETRAGGSYDLDTQYHKRDNEWIAI